MGAPRQRSIDKLLEKLDTEERAFVLDWLADHGTSVSDDLFLPAALTARLIIEQQRFSDRLREIVREDVQALKVERVALHADIDIFRAEVAAIRGERGTWLAAARESVVRGASDAASDIEKRVGVAVTKLSAAVDEPVAPIRAALENLPDAVSNAASAGAQRGVKSAQVDAMTRIGAWARSRVLIAVTILIVVAVLGFFIGRLTSSPSSRAAIPASAHHARAPGHHR